jgi:hypothetical protein
MQREQKKDIPRAQMTRLVSFGPVFAAAAYSYPPSHLQDTDITQKEYIQLVSM